MVFLFLCLFVFLFLPLTNLFSLSFDWHIFGHNKIDLLVLAQSCGKDGFSPSFRLSKVNYDNTEVCTNTLSGWEFLLRAGRTEMRKPGAGLHVPPRLCFCFSAHHCLISLWSMETSVSGVVKRVQNISHQERMWLFAQYNSLLFIFLFKGKNVYCRRS